MDGKCLTLINAARTELVDKRREWAQIFKETAEALSYLHSKEILHNDIKGDNVIISSRGVGYYAVLIDFGKARKVCDAKCYSLTKQEQERYRQHHWHIAPELIRGTCRQSTASDVFSYGVLLRWVCKCRHFSGLLRSVAKNCMHISPCKRPSLGFVCEQLSL